jgi:hypothetical protein
MKMSRDRINQTQIYLGKFQVLEEDLGEWLEQNQRRILNGSVGRE